MLLRPFLCVSVTLALTRSSQIPLRAPSKESEVQVDSAPWIFNSVVDSLSLAGQIAHPAGHAFTLATIEAGTVGWQGRFKNDLSASPEWLALATPEMSLGLVLGFRGRPPPNSSWLFSYAITEPLRVVYIDGLSAALFDGPQDSQQVFVEGTRAEWAETYNEWRRASRLCNWAKDHRIEGFIRTNLGFELLLCDFETPKLRRLDAINVTRAQEDLRIHVGGEWERVVQGIFRRPVSQVTLDFSTYNTLYDPRYTSLSAERNGTRQAAHRLTTISATDVESFRQAVNEAIDAAESSRVDLRGIAQDIVARYSDDLLLLNDSSRFDQHAQYIATAWLLPFVDTAEASDPIERCSTQFTRALDFVQLSRPEQLVKHSLETVSRRICSFAVEAAAGLARLDQLQTLLVYLDWTTFLGKVSLWNDDS